MIKRYYLKIPGFGIVLLCVCGYVSCKQSSSVLPPSSDSTCFYNGVDTCNQKNGKLILVIHPDEVKQTIHSFGASDGWTTKFIGQWADVDKKNKIADLLFSMDTSKDGTPKGIGLSLWRFNIGAGSYEQGDTSGIATDWRREECFLKPDGTYDWSKEAGHQWFLQAARQSKVKYTLGFALSPPVSMTANGKASARDAKGVHLNIQQDKLDNYADFLVKVATHFKFDYISPVNEPQYQWGGDGSTVSTQEGSQATDDDIAALVKLLSQKLQAQHSSARVVIGEAGTWEALYTNNSDGRGDQINQFFSSASKDYIGNLPGVAQVISAHSYYTTCPDHTLVDTRQQVADKINQVDPALETWMTEFGVLGNICSALSGSPRSTGINYGLYVAKVINSDLTIANVSSWQWWLAVSPYNYSDGLVYINDASGKINVNNCKQDGIVLESKQLWSLGNYSRFIRPGMQRVAASIKDLDRLMAASSVMVSAYKDQQDKKMVIVLVNMTTKTKTLQVDEQDGFAIQGNLLNTYTTDATRSLTRAYAHPDSIVLSPRSVVTLTGIYQ
jgi:hypothetical protein